MIDQDQTHPMEPAAAPAKRQWETPALDVLPLHGSQNNGSSMPFDGASPSPS